MAYHFQPQADSSDDEQVDISAWQTGAEPKRKTPHPAPVGTTSDGGADAESSRAIGSSTSKIGSGPGNAIEVEDGDDTSEDEEEVEEEVVIDNTQDRSRDNGVERSQSRESTGSSSSVRKRKRELESFASTGFTPVNKPAAVNRPDSSEDELTLPTPPAQPFPIRSRRTASSSKDQKQTGRLVPVIPRFELDDDDLDDIVDYTKGGDVVRRVKKEFTGKDRFLTYKVEFEDRHVEEVRIGFNAFWLV